MIGFASVPRRRTVMASKHRSFLGLLCGLLVMPITISAAQAADDHGDSPETATLLPISSPVTGMIGHTYDVDYFRIDLVGRTRVDISTSGPTDTRGWLFDGTGEMLASYDNTGPQGHNFRIARYLEPGVYYVRVVGARSARADRSAPGNYAISARTRASWDNHDDTAATSTLLPFYGEATIARASPAALLSTAGRIRPAAGDLDVFRIDVPRDGTDATVRAAGGTDTYGRLLDSSLTEIGSDDGAEGPFRIEKRLDAGIYYLEVRGHENGDYRVLAWGDACSCVESSITAMDHGGTVETATLMSIGAPLTGTVADAADMDVFRVDLPGSATVHFSTAGPTDTRGELRDGTGVILATDDNSGSQGHNFSMSADLARGVYYLIVSGDAGNYAVSALLGGTRDHGDTPALSTLLPFHSGDDVSRITPGVLLSTVGRIWPKPADIDVFRIDVLADRTDATVRIAGSVAIYGRLLDGSLTEIAADDGDNGNFRIEKLLDAGIYYVEVGGHETEAYRILAWGDARERGAPSLPGNLAAASGDREVRLTWTASVDDGGSAILRHEYRQRTEGGTYGDWTAIPDSAPGGTNATSFAVTGLENGVRVFFEVRAVNAAGAGLSSNEAATTPPEVRLSTERVIARARDEVHVQVADLDGDGVPDVLVVEERYAGQNITWYKNDGKGAFSYHRTIGASDHGHDRLPVHAADLDGDGDLDVLAALNESSMYGAYTKIVWYENAGGGEFLAKPRIGVPISSLPVLGVHAADLDGDGDADVLGSGHHEIWWSENEGGGDFRDAPRVFGTDSDRYVSVRAADLDGDGDPDVLAAFAKGKVVWHTNYGGVFSAQRVIASDGGGSPTVDAVDLDGDGDADVLAASVTGIAWYENDGAFSGPRMITAADAMISWPKDRIGRPSIRSSSIGAVDLDGDGDTDVLAATESGVVLYGNRAGGFSAPQALTAGANPVLSVQAADLDGDGDADVLSAPMSEKTVWYENLSDHGDDHGDAPPAATLATALPAFLHGVLESTDDRDVFRVATGSGTLRVSSNGSTDTFGSLLDVGGGQLAADDDAGLNANFAIAAEVAAGTHYVDVRSVSGATGPYTLSLTFEAADDHADSREAATPVAFLPWSGRGRLERGGDRDVFQIDVPEDGVVRVQAEGGADTYLVLTDADGAILDEADNSDAGPGVEISVDVADGVHYVEVRVSGGSLGDYRLSIEFVSHAGRDVAFEEAGVDLDYPIGVVLDPADLDGDGDLDLVSGVYWNENQGGTFPPSARRKIIADGSAHPVRIVADLDNDGDPDLLTSPPPPWEYREVDKSIAWHENEGGGAFSAQRVISTDEARVLSVYAADLNGDGYPDVISRRERQDYLDVYTWSENHGDGAFSAQRELVDVGGRLRGAADLDGDGDADLVVTMGQREIAWYENEGGGEFAPLRRIAVFTRASSLIDVQAADLDGDGDPDLLATIPNGIAWYENEGGGEFSAERLIAFESDFDFAVRTADLDGDRDLDIVSARAKWLPGFGEYAEEVVAWYENYGGRAFSSERVIDKYFANSVRTADLDSDGDADVLVVAWGSEGLFVSVRSHWNLSDHGDDHGNDPTAATFAPVLPAFLHGVLESSGDRDVFRMATGNGKLWVRSNGPTDTFGRVLDADGSELAANDGFGADLNFAIAAEVAAGAHYVEVSSVSGATGAYTLSISFAGQAGSSAGRATRTGLHGSDPVKAVDPHDVGSPDAPSASRRALRIASTWKRGDKDQDGVRDDEDSDLDRDGLTNSEESIMGTDPSDGTSAGMRRHLVSYLPAAWTAGATGLVRVINHADRRGALNIRAIDDRGREFNALPLRIGPHQALEFDTGHLETGGAGLGRGIGSGDGDWRLDIESDPDDRLELDVLAYLRTPDGLLAPVHNAARVGNVHRLPTFALGARPGAEATLRVFNRRRASADIAIRGIDDQGRDSGAVHATVPAGEVRSFTATELGAGMGGVRGALGTADGGWRLAVTSQQPIVAIGLLRSPTGHLASLPPALRKAPDEAYLIPLFPRAGDGRGHGVLRVINRLARPGDLRVSAIDDLGRRYGPLPVALRARATVELNAGDLEQGNPAKGVVGGLGSALAGAWRLELSTDLDVEVVAYLRNVDGFVAPIHASARLVSDVHFVGTFNPAARTPGASLLRLVNPGSGPAVVTVRGIDDTGTAAVGDVRLTIPGGQGRSLSARALETGAGDGAGGMLPGLRGALGRGDGRWRLLVTATGPIMVASALSDGHGHPPRSSTIQDDRGDTRYPADDLELAPE